MKNQNSQLFFSPIAQQSKIPTKILFFKIGLLIIGLFFGIVESQAQVSSDGNIIFQAYSSSSTATISGFSVPSGTKSLLVVYTISTQSRTTTDVTFDGTPLTKLGELASSYSTSIWYLAQGDLASPISGDIVATFSASNFGGGIYAISYKNVDQSTPMEHFESNEFGLSTTPSLSVNSDSSNDLIVDFITARNFGATPILTAGTDQTKLGEQGNQLTSAGSNSTHALSHEPSSGSTVSMDWTTSPHSGGSNALHIAANINGGGGNPGVPTLSEWGLINLAILLLTFGTIYLINPNFSLQKKRIKE